MPELAEAMRLRAIATEYSDLARVISFRPDRELLLQRARELEDRATKLEQRRADRLMGDAKLKAEAGRGGGHRLHLGKRTVRCPAVG